MEKTVPADDIAVAFESKFSDCVSDSSSSISKHRSKAQEGAIESKRLGFNQERCFVVFTAGVIFPST